MVNKDINRLKTVLCETKIKHLLGVFVIFSYEVSPFVTLLL